MIKGCGGMIGEGDEPINIHHYIGKSTQEEQTSPSDAKQDELNDEEK